MRSATRCSAATRLGCAAAAVRPTNRSATALTKRSAFPGSCLFTAPLRDAAGLVLEQDAGVVELLADAIRLGEVFGFARGVSRGDHFLNGEVSYQPDVVSRMPMEDVIHL